MTKFKPHLLAAALILACAGSARCEDKPEGAEAKKEAAEAVDFTYVAKVVKVFGATMTVHSFRGHSGIIHDENTTDKTIFLPNGKPGKIEDFKEGDWVKISWNQNPKRVVKIETTVPPETFVGKAGNKI